jgi:hypothetical protein
MSPFVSDSTALSTLDGKNRIFVWNKFIISPKNKGKSLIISLELRRFRPLFFVFILEASFIALWGEGINVIHI